jgi:hypothetical protein
VFSTPWPEPAGSSTSNKAAITPDRAFDTDDAQSHTIFGNGIFVEIRRFLVVKAFTHHSLCIPISTHHRNGVLGRPDAENHSVIYTSDDPPSQLPGETLDKYAIKVELDRDEEGEHLHPVSRVNYSQTYTVQHNIKVKKVGRVSKDNMQWVKTYWRACTGDELR